MYFLTDNPNKCCLNILLKTFLLLIQYEKKIRTVQFFIFSKHYLSLYGNDFQYSTAGFYNHEKNYRKVVNFNVGWKYYRGDVKNAMSTDFDDSKWDVISTPHTVELLPSNASGGRNYQGVVWYRKRFELDDSYLGQKFGFILKPSWVRVKST